MYFEEHIKIENAVIQQVELEEFNGVDVFIKREELLHPALSGNKWRKLKYNLIKAKEEGHTKLLTFGGAFSNHIYAVAAAGSLFGFETIGIIRGEEQLPLNPTLDFAVKNGMQLVYLPRSIYRKRNEKDFQLELSKQFGDAYVIPEGGTNLLALKGVAEMIYETKVKFDYYISAVGSGGTAAGIIAALNGESEFIGIPALKGGAYLAPVISDFVLSYTGKDLKNWRLETDYHFGGFAKFDKELVEFTNRFEQQNGIKLEPLYTGKMMYALADLIKRRKIRDGTSVLAIHTGGLQGLNGLKAKIRKLLNT